MTRSDLLSLAAAVETDGVAAHNEAVAVAFGYVFCELWAPPGETDASKWTADPPDFSNLAVAADHTPKDWHHCGGYFDFQKTNQHHWIIGNPDRLEADGYPIARHSIAPDEASARNAASLRALAEDADA